MLRKLVIVTTIQTFYCNLKVDRSVATAKYHCAVTAKYHKSKGIALGIQGRIGGFCGFIPYHRLTAGAKFANCQVIRSHTQFSLFECPKSENKWSMWNIGPVGQNAQLPFALHFF